MIDALTVVDKNNTVVVIMCREGLIHSTASAMVVQDVVMLVSRGRGHVKHYLG